MRSELLPNVRVVPLAVELRIGQHQPNAGLLGSRFDNGGQIRTVVSRTASRTLRQQELLIQVRHDHPLQPMPPGQGFLAVMVQATHKERADRSLCQARRVHAHGVVAGLSASAAQPTYGLADRLVDGLLVQPLQETIQRSEIGHAGESERLTQFAMSPSRTPASQKVQSS